MCCLRTGGASASERRASVPLVEHADRRSASLFVRGLTNTADTEPALREALAAHGRHLVQRVRNPICLLFLYALDWRLNLSKLKDLFMCMCVCVCACVCMCVRVCVWVWVGVRLNQFVYLELGAFSSR